MMRKKKVIFIPGAIGGKKDMILINKMLKEYDIKYFPYDTGLKNTIEQYSEKLKEFIDELKLEKDEKISIISISAGGIIAEYYLKYLESGKVDKIVTLFTPFKGTWLPHFIYKKKKGFQELRKNSIILEKISNKKLIDIEELNIWCWLDPVVPGKSGKGSNPMHVLFPIHGAIQFWPPVIVKIKKFLS